MIPTAGVAAAIDGKVQGHVRAEALAHECHPRPASRVHGRDAIPDALQHQSGEQHRLLGLEQRQGRGHQGVLGTTTMAQSPRVRYSTASARE
jgi:hypothetical protein